MVVHPMNIAQKNSPANAKLPKSHQAHRDGAIADSISALGSRDRDMGLSNVFDHQARAACLLR